MRVYYIHAYLHSYISKESRSIYPNNNCHSSVSRESSQFPPEYGHNPSPPVCVCVELLIKIFFKKLLLTTAIQKKKKN